MPKTLKFQKLFLEIISNIFYVTFVTYMRYNCRHVAKLCVNLKSYLMTLHRENRGDRRENENATKWARNVF